MVLKHWWMIVIWLAIVGLLYQLYRSGKLASWAKTSTPRVKVARSERITGLPIYAQIKARYRRWLLAVLACLFAAITSTMVLTARPASQSIVSAAQLNRDIILCLDVSGSMLPVDAKIVETFEKLVNDFKGQRIGMDIFNGLNSQFFPLTDDYDLVKEQLAFAKKELKKDPFGQGEVNEELRKHLNFIAGTLAAVSTSNVMPNSNVGLGLAGCIGHLGDNKTGRSQSIILATDNELSGDPTDKESIIISTPEAMMLAKKKSIRVYSIDPGVTDPAAGGASDTPLREHAELKLYSIATGGGYYLLSQHGVVPDVINKISQQEEKLFVSDPQLAYADSPMVPIIIASLALLGLVALTWRLKL
ncbi:MAG: hypothetical protein WAQ25_01790 [Candidatus Saccharimonas sp.]